MTDEFCGANRPVESEMTDKQPGDVLKLLSELNRAKVLFQQRAIVAAMGISERPRQTDIAQPLNQKGE